MNLSDTKYWFWWLQQMAPTLSMAKLQCPPFVRWCAGWLPVFCSAHTLKMIKFAARVTLFSQSWTFGGLWGMCASTAGALPVTTCYLFAVLITCLINRFVILLSHCTNRVWVILVTNILELMLGCFTTRNAYMAFLRSQSFLRNSLARAL